MTVRKVFRITNSLAIYKLQAKTKNENAGETRGGERELPNLNPVPTIVIFGSTEAAATPVAPGVNRSCAASTPVHDGCHGDRPALPPSNYKFFL
jgi:hypothetical protein